MNSYKKYSKPNMYTNIAIIRGYEEDIWLILELLLKYAD